MAANPVLVRAADGELLPAPFANEAFALKRSGVEIDIDGMRTRNGRWNVRGSFYLSNMRLCFVGEKPDPSGLVAFDLPLAYIQNDALNQPIFGCNNLSGRVWPAAEGGGPGGTLTPHDFKIYFKEGGIGTFYPLYYVMVGRAREAMRSAAARAASPQQAAEFVQSAVSRAFVDPNDPSTVYLSQPVGEAQRLSQQPVYAANYGREEDEMYEDMGLRP